jgi:hypothetical protein
MSLANFPEGDKDEVVARCEALTAECVALYEKAVVTKGGFPLKVPSRCEDVVRWHYLLMDFKTHASAYLAIPVAAPNPPPPVAPVTVQPKLTVTERCLAAKKAESPTHTPVVIKKHPTTLMEATRLSIDERVRIAKAAEKKS